MNYFKILPVITTKDNVSLTICEKDNLPFSVKRFFVIYGFDDNNIPRGFHAHKKCEQMIFCLSGSAKVHRINKNFESTHRLFNTNHGLYIPPMTWNELIEIKKDSVILVLASMEYDESDYIRDYNEFLGMIK